MTSLDQVDTFIDPAVHSYLGEHLRDTHVRHNIVASNPHSTYDLLLIPLTDIVLFPGETCPLRLQDPTLISHIKRVIEATELNHLRANNDENVFIGVVNMSSDYRYPSRYRRRELRKTGCTLEVKSLFHETGAASHSFHSHQGDEMVLMGKGRYRFEIVSIRRVEHSISYATIKILEDISHTGQKDLKYEINPFPNWVYQINSAETLARRAYSLVLSSAIWQESPDLLFRWGPPQASHQQEDPNPTSTYTCTSAHEKAAAAFKHTSAHTYFDTSSSFGSIATVEPSMKQAGLKQAPFHPWQPSLRYYDSANSHRNKYGAEIDPVGFSFSLAANLPVSIIDLQTLLETCDVIERLRLAIDLLERGKKKKLLGCERCGQPIAAKEDIFTVPGAEGVTGAYVNPHGAVHQTITVKALRDRNRCVESSGRPTAQDSWFPGYAWTIIHCSRCYHHLGWHFTLVATERRHQTHSHSSRDASDYEQEDDDDIDDDDGGDEEEEEEEEEGDGASAAAGNWRTHRLVNLLSQARRHLSIPPSPQFIDFEQLLANLMQNNNNDDHNDDEILTMNDSDEDEENEEEEEEEDDDGTGDGDDYNDYDHARDNYDDEEVSVEEMYVDEEEEDIDSDSAVTAEDIPTAADGSTAAFLEGPTGTVQDLQEDSSSGRASESFFAQGSGGTATATIHTSVNSGAPPDSPPSQEQQLIYSTATAAAVTATPAATTDLPVSADASEYIDATSSGTPRQQQQPQSQRVMQFWGIRTPALKEL